MAHSPDEFARIRRIFLERKGTYTVAEAAALLAMTPRFFADRRMEPERGAEVAWEEVVHEAMEKYSVRYIEEALGEDADRALPSLLRTIEVTLRLPQVYILYVAELARHKGWLAEDLIGWYMRGELGPPNNFRQLERDHPGFSVALDFPYTAGRR